MVRDEGYGAAGGRHTGPGRVPAQHGASMRVCVRACVCAHACVRACVRACVHACVRARACMRHVGWGRRGV